MAVVESTSQQSDCKNQLVRNPNNVQVNMDPDPLNFDECLKDSPKFRQSLRDNLMYIENLEACMSRTIKQITNYIETGRNHIKSQKDFIFSMKTLNSSLGASNIDVSKRVNTLLGTLEEIMLLHEIVIDQSARTVGTSLSKFINDDLQKIKEARKSFDKISHEFDQALTRYSQPVKKKQDDDSENLLIATSTAFTHTSLDLSIQLTTLQAKKGYDILGSLLSFTRAHSTFFHQGSDLFEDLKPHIADMDGFLNNVQDEFETMVRSLPSKHLMVSNNELRPLCFDNKAQHVHLEGYLFKRASNGFKVWNRRWFILKDHQLLYQKRGDTQPTIMEEDLRLLTVRPVDRADNDRRFCFEVLSPHKSHILQADSEAACKTWIGAIQAGINAAFHDTENKSMPQTFTATELAAATNSWSSSFSFKALQQQATSRLNSIATLGDNKEGTKTQLKERPINGISGDENDDDQDRPFKVDDQGRSYAPLRGSDDQDDKADDIETKNVAQDSGSKPTYPVAASEERSESKMAPPLKPQRAYMIILAMPGNNTCADCGATDPKWASINLGITLCIECAGIHRSLGVHLSKVRSLTLDTEVWSPEIVQLMLSLGNTCVNSAYLACYRNQLAPIDSSSGREDRENWIKSKYLLKKFMRPPEEEEAVVDSSGVSGKTGDDKKKQGDDGTSRLASGATLEDSSATTSVPKIRGSEPSSLPEVVTSTSSSNAASVHESVTTAPGALGKDREDLALGGRLEPPG